MFLNVFLGLGAVLSYFENKSKQTELKRELKVLTDSTQQDVSIDIAGQSPQTK
jgi:hypothetical protein